MTAIAIHIWYLVPLVLLAIVGAVTLCAAGLVVLFEAADDRIRNHSGELHHD